MHIPKGKPVHEHLKTSYVNTAALLADLQISGFTGYLQITFPYGQGYIFIDAGKILNAFDEGGDRSRRGEEAIDAILLRVASPDGNISVYTFNSAVIEAIAGRIDGEAIYQGLESEFTDLKKLIGKLVQQKETRFYIEVKIGNTGDAVIYIIDGNIDAVLSLANGEIIEGDDGYDRIVALVAGENAIFHVYRYRPPVVVAANVIAFPEPSPISEPAFMGVDRFKVAQPVHKPLDNIATEVAHESVVEIADELADERVDESVAEVADKPAYTLADSLSLEMAKASDNGNSLIKDAEYEEAEFKAQFEKLIDLMSEVVAEVERSSAKVAKDGNFAVALRAGLLEVTELYPFFDPFTSEFEYQDGKIRFSAAAAPIELVNGLTQALKFALRELTRMAPAAILRQVVADALSKLQHRRRAEFEHFGLAPVLTEIVALD